MEDGDKDQEQQRLDGGDGEDEEGPHPRADVSAGHRNQGGEADQRPHHRGVGELEEEHAPHAQQPQNNRLGTLAHHEAAEAVVEGV